MRGRRGPRSASSPKRRLRGFGFVLAEPRLEGEADALGQHRRRLGCVVAGSQHPDGILAAHRGYLKLQGEWNYEEVTVKGSTVRVELNGTVILDGDLAPVTEYESNKPHPGKDRTRGFFGFCGAVGILLATGVGGRLFDEWMQSGPFVFVGAMNFAVFLFALIVCKVSPGPKPLTKAERKAALEA